VFRPCSLLLCVSASTKNGWVYEKKYDGYRILAHKEGDRVQLLSRNAIDCITGFTAVAAALRGLRPATLMLDGEVVVFDRQGVSRFQLLQNNGQFVYTDFDCLYKNGRYLRPEPLSARRIILEQSVGPGQSNIAFRSLTANGLEAYRVVQAQEYEGIVPKNSRRPILQIVRRHGSRSIRRTNS